MIPWWVYVLGFLLVAMTIGSINQMLQRRHERKLAQITGEAPDEYDGLEQ
jgi:hypothetical protein